MKIPYKKILKYQKNRKPFLFLDEIYKIKIGKFAFAKKKVSSKEWFFKVHWPGDPNMPGVLQVESILQTAALIILSKKNYQNKIMYLDSLQEFKFKRKILPNSILDIRTYCKSFKRGIGDFEGEIRIKENLVCKGRFKLLLPHLISSKYRVTKK